MLDILFVLAFLVPLAFVFRRMRMRTFAREDASLKIQNIESDLVAWAGNHPGYNFSHPEAQRIIRRCIKRMNRIRRRNRQIAEERIAKLIKLLN